MKISRRQALSLAAGIGLGPLTACVARESAPGKTGETTAKRTSPMLLVTEAELAATRRAIASDTVAAQWHQAILHRAEGILKQPPTSREFEPKRPVLLLTSRRVLDRVRTLGGLWLLNREPRYAARAKAELAAAAAFPDWNPSHFLDTAEMAHAFALGLSWLDDALTTEEKQDLRAALVAKAIEPGLEAHARSAHWTRSTNNWNLVCNGGLVLAALTVEHDDPERARKLIETALGSVQVALASYAPDGGWNEGPVYWSYATHYTSLLIAGYESVRGPSQIAAAPGLADTGLFALHFTAPAGRTFNFADSGEENYGGPHLFWLARRFDRPLYASYYRKFVGSRPGILDLLWYDPRIATPEQMGVPTAAYFRRTEAAFLRGSWTDPDATWAAIKGGDNAASHAHLDLGTFVLESGGERFAIDLGGDDYALPGYFGSQRFNYYRTASRGHNLFLPAGLNQASKALAEIREFQAAGDAYAIVDLDAAWPALATAKRGLALVDGRHVVISDEVTRQQPEPWTWQMHTYARVSVAGASARLDRREATLHLHLLEPSEASFALEPVQVDPPEAPNTGVSRLFVQFEPETGPIRVIVLASPDPEPSADVVARALRPLVSWSG